MKRLAALLVLVLCLPLAARADVASRWDKARELLLLLHTDRLLQQMMDGVMNQTGTATKQMLGNNSLTPEQQKRLDDFQTRLFAFVESNMSCKSLEPDYINLYADNFTDAELDDLLAFYKSPSGQSLIEKLPVITAQSLQLGQKRMLTVLPQVQQMIKDFAQNCTDCVHPAGVGGTGGLGAVTLPLVRLRVQSKAASDPAFYGQGTPVSSGVMAGNIIQQPEPVYPPMARAAHVQGTVILRALIGKDGHVENLSQISGPPLLVDAAMDAVKQWVYKPYLVNGEPTEVQTTVNVNYTFSAPASSPASATGNSPGADGPVQP